MTYEQFIEKHQIGISALHMSLGDFGGFEEVMLSHKGRAFFFIRQEGNVRVRLGDILKDKIGEFTITLSQVNGHCSVTEEGFNQWLGWTALEPQDVQDFGTLPFMYEKALQKAGNVRDFLGEATEDILKIEW